MRSLRYAVTTRARLRSVIEQINMNRQDAKAAKETKLEVMRRESMDIFMTGFAFALPGGLGGLAVPA